MEVLAAMVVMEVLASMQYWQHFVSMLPHVPHYFHQFVQQFGCPSLTRFSGLVHFPMALLLKSPLFRCHPFEQ